MGRFVWFRRLIVIVAVVGTMLFSLQSITDKQVENNWTIPAGSRSLLPLTNGSIVLYTDLKKLREQVIQQKKQCRHLKEDPFTMFNSKPSNTTQFTADKDISRIQLAFMCGGALYPEYLTALPREKLYPFEAFYLSDPPLWNNSTVACHNHSTISLYGAGTTFVVGDAVSFVITMFDGEGRPRLKGGDRIKVWLKDVKFNHSISADITDFNNGTYLATTVLPWAGTVRVMATLRQPREFFRALAYVHRTLKSTIPFFGAYSNVKASEGAPCSPIPLVPGYGKSELCNLTSESGSPWYCGRPSKRELNCSDYHLHRFSMVLIDMPVTPAEVMLLRQPTKQNNFLAGNIILNVEASGTSSHWGQEMYHSPESTTVDNGHYWGQEMSKSGIRRLQDPNVPCNKVSPRATWYQPVPSGYFYHKVWKSFLCFIPDQPEKVDESCLKNVHMIFYGDSNGRCFYHRVQSKVKCNETVYSINGQTYHARKICENKTQNFSIQCFSHAPPFHTGLGVFINTSYLHSPEKVLGSLPAQGRYLFVFNHYLHFTSHHFSVYERALIAVRDAVLRLLKRNPHVLIMLRGPHVSERDPYTYFVGDVWGQYIAAIQKETFRELQDRVIYFPTWDITVASEDRTFHPMYNNHLSDVMLHYLCGRDQ